jgi:large subunit ribosomal protein L17
MKGKKLGRKSSHLKALLYNLANSLIEHEQIVTTHSKAKELRPYVEKLVTLAKKGDLASRRIALSILRNDEGVAKLFSVIGPRYKARSGGYTRIIKAGFRFGDAAPVGVIEFVDRDISAKGKKDLARVKQERAEQLAEQAA